MDVLSDEVAAAARAFLASALPVLEEQRVVPPPIFHPHIKVGRDYYGPDLMHLPEYAVFEQAIEQAHTRFADNRTIDDDLAFPSGYIFSFLEACVARSCRKREQPAPTGSAVDESVADLTAALGAETWEVACCPRGLTPDDG